MVTRQPANAQKTVMMQLKMVSICIYVLGLLLGTSVQAQYEAGAQTNAPLAGLDPPTDQLAATLATLDLTKLASLLPVLAQLDPTVIAQTVTVLEKIDPSKLEPWVSVINSLTPNIAEAVIAALPSIDVAAVMQLLPEVSALPTDTLTGYLKLMGKVNPTTLEHLLPSLISLDANWLATVVPALNQIDPNYLAAVVKAVAPHLMELSPDTILQLMPALSSLEVGTWENLIELLNNITPAQLSFLVHLMEVTGPYLDVMAGMMNTLRGMLTPESKPKETTLNLLGFKVTLRQAAVEPKTGSTGSLVAVGAASMGVAAANPLGHRALLAMRNVPQ